MLNLPTDMQGLDLEAIREWIRDKCDHVGRQKQTELIPGTGKRPIRPRSQDGRERPQIPDGLSRWNVEGNPVLKMKAHSWCLEGY